MASTYSSVIGSVSFPDVGQYGAWEAQYFRLLNHRLAHAPLARASTYHFSQSGNDATGDGSQGNPWKTLAKAQATLNASAGDVRLRLRRGDEWNEATGLTVNKPNVTVDDYTTAATPAARPLLNRFTVKYNAAGWAEAGVTDRWTRAEPGDIAWVRDQADRLTPYTQVNATALVESTPRSFYWDAGGAVLHVNAGAGVSPNTKNLEAVVSNTADGVLVSGADGCRVENLRADGWGLHRTTAAIQRHGVRVEVSGTDAALVVGCESYFSGSRAMAVYVPGTAGGIATFVRCRGGYVRYVTGGGGAVFNTYNGSGGQETIFHECEAAYGTLPSHEWTPGQRFYGGAFFGHTGGASLSLAVCYGCVVRTTAGASSCLAGATFANAPAAGASRAAARAFVVREVVETWTAADAAGWSPIPRTFQPGCSGNEVRCGCRWLSGVKSTADTAVLVSSMRGWWLNCSLLVQVVVSPSGHVGLTSNAAADDILIDQCHLAFDNSVTAAASRNVVLNFFTFGGTLRNTVLQYVKPTGGGTLDLGSAVNTAQRLVNNAYYNCLLGSYSNDAGKITLTDPLPPEHRPAPDSPLYRTGAGAVAATHDPDARPRIPSAPSIGPASEFVPLLRSKPVVGGGTRAELEVLS